jgi:transposase InsO family protein
MTAEGGKPAAFVSDNGTELTSMRPWPHRPRQPQQNAFIQSLSFNGRLRDAL